MQFLKEDSQNIEILIDGLLTVKDVVKGAGQLAMRELDQDNVELLISSNPDEWPSIYVTKSDKGYICFDGQHRIKAAQLLKREKILATCRTIPDVNSLIEITFRANLRHGLQASMETRGDYCYWLAITYPELTQAKIAERVGLSQSRVSKAIAQRKKAMEEMTEEQPESQEEEQYSELDAWREGLVKRMRTLVKSASKYSATIKVDGNYQELVSEVQQELVQAPEDREVILFTGQLLVDAAQRRARLKRLS